MSSAMHSRKGFFCDRFIIKTLRLGISHFQAENLPRGKSRVFFFLLPSNNMQIDGKFTLLSKHTENKSRFLDKIIPKGDTLSHSQMEKKPVSYLLKVSPPYASR